MPWTRRTPRALRREPGPLASDTARGASDDRTGGTALSSCCSGRVFGEIDGARTPRDVRVERSDALALAPFDGRDSRGETLLGQGDRASLEGMDGWDGAAEMNEDEDEDDASTDFLGKLLAAMTQGTAREEGTGAAAANVSDEARDG